jgi:hypothetical protein
MVYLTLLLLMRTPQLPVVDRTDAPADLNGLVRFAGRRNLVSARVPSRFKCSLSTYDFWNGAEKEKPKILGRKTRPNATFSTMYHINWQEMQPEPPW